MGLGAQSYSNHSNDTNKCTMAVVESLKCYGASRLSEGWGLGLGRKSYSEKVMLGLRAERWESDHQANQGGGITVKTKHRQRIPKENVAGRRELKRCYVK